MEVILDIHERLDGDLTVRELSYEQDQYDEMACEQFVQDSLCFNNSASVTVLLSHVATEDGTVLKAYLHDHSSTDVENTFSMDSDGWYTVRHVIAPTITWIGDVRTYGADFGSWAHVYVIDDGVFKEYDDTDRTYTEVDFEDVWENREGSNIFFKEAEVFRTWSLRNCYLAHCAEQIDRQCWCSGGCPECSDSDLYWTNVLWIVLNAIRFLIEKGEPDEAMRMYNTISGSCGALCRGYRLTEDNDCDCGQ